MQNGGPRIVWSARGTTSESFPATPLLPLPWLLSVSQLLETDPHRAPQPADWASPPGSPYGCGQPPHPAGASLVPATAPPETSALVPPPPWRAQPSVGW